MQVAGGRTELRSGSPVEEGHPDARREGWELSGKGSTRLWYQDPVLGSRISDRYGTGEQMWKVVSFCLFF